MKLTFIGDTMLGRFVSYKYKAHPYIVISEEVQRIARESDYIVANLESPITSQKSENSLAFAGDFKLLNQFKWIDTFSISNNHINDFGEKGISETIQSLDQVGIAWNGVYGEIYRPCLIETKDDKIAIITCTDMLNEEFDNSCKYHVLRADSPKVNQFIHKYTQLGYFTILFSHCGSLFSRFPNPQIRDILYSAIDSGARCIVTCHSHCLGGVDLYKGIPIFYSLGDFLMDGGSYRRRRACILQMEIKDGKVGRWNITPTVTSKGLQTILPDEKLKKRMLHDFENVSNKMQNNHENYPAFYKWQYKLEIFNHSLSTLRYLYDSKGLVGFLKILWVRIGDVKRMIHRIIFGRSSQRFDTDAVSKNFKNSDII